MDTRFEPFQSTLFSQAGVEVDRDKSTKAESEALDASIAAYSRLLTDHFLNTAVFQTLEYLIRRYRYWHAGTPSLTLCSGLSKPLLLFAE